MIECTAAFAESHSSTGIAVVILQDEDPPVWIGQLKAHNEVNDMRDHSPFINISGY